MPDQEEVSPVLHSLCSSSPFVAKPERDRSLSCATTRVHSSSLRSSTTYKMMDYSMPTTDSSIQVYQRPRAALLFKITDSVTSSATILGITMNALSTFVDRNTLMAFVATDVMDA
ncbi:hypothetical protein MRB53_016408 [Persea americana]|uniref:Uncharacterized protein n=1 Tax=Persea americana TaxID=3435 RepID=A0ACC2M1Y6_PERAE|nr:hypothetical protein MRB53_016408 [Persea americana]